MIIPVSELQPGDFIVKPGGLNVRLYQIQETWPLTDNEFAARINYINSFMTAEKYWKNSSVEVLVDRPE